MTKYIKVDNAYINTAYIVSVGEVTNRYREGDEWKTSKYVEIRTVDNGLFFFNGTVDDAIELIKGKGEEE